MTNLRTRLARRLRFAAAHAWLPARRLTEPGQWRRPRVIPTGELDFHVDPWR